MVRFVELAKDCMADHEDIPDGKDVMRELLAIRQACVADEDGTALEAEPAPSTSTNLWTLSVLSQNEPQGDMPLLLE